MAFHSAIFIVIFVPIVLIGFHAASQVGKRQAAIGWLAACSLVFYAGWQPQQVWVPLVSLLANWTFARLIARNRRSNPRAAGLLTYAGVTFNVLLLASYKLVDAGLIDVPGRASGTFSTAHDLLIPLGLSFITFQQIAFLIDVRNERIDPKPLDYAFFILFFPQLVMGPIVRFREIIPQTNAPAFLGLKWDNIAVGIAIFAVGLFKKVGLADAIATYVNVVFAPAEAGASIGMVDAWAAAFAFQFQIYFDFSGYADMAIGLARMLNINIPINFDSPFRSLDRFDVWRRWHISFAVFMRWHVFWPLRRNKTFPLSPMAALTVTLFIGGLWHGLGTTFVLWALAQAVILLIGHQRRELWRRTHWRVLAPGPRWGRIAVTMSMAACLGVVFRAESVSAAMQIYKGMIGWYGFGFPVRVAELLGITGIPDGYAGETYLGGRALVYLSLAAFIIYVMPPTQQLFERYWTAIDQRGEQIAPAPGLLPALERRIRFEFTLGWALFVASLFILAALSFNRPTRFIYFQF